MKEDERLAGESKDKWATAEGLEDLRRAVRDLKVASGASMRMVDEDMVDVQQADGPGVERRPDSDGALGARSEYSPDRAARAWHVFLCVCASRCVRWRCAPQVRAQRKQEESATPGAYLLTPDHFLSIVR